MARGFDSSEVVRKKVAREELQERLDAADKVLAELEDLDEESAKLRKKLESAQSVHPIVYKEYRRPGSRWMIEHAISGDDYVYQLFPLKPPAREWQDVVALAIAAMDAVFPRSVDIVYRPPNDKLGANFYTVTVKKIVGTPGWESACTDRALRTLSSIEAWG